MPVAVKVGFYHFVFARGFVTLCVAARFRHAFRPFSRIERGMHRVSVNDIHPVSMDRWPKLDSNSQPHRITDQFENLAVSK